MHCAPSRVSRVVQLRQATRLARPPCDVRPRPDETNGELCQRLREILVAPTPCMHVLSMRLGKSLGDLGRADEV
jgi:hypothetical protein